MESQDFAKDLPKKDNFGSKFLVGNTLMFKNYWQILMRDLERKGPKDQFIVLNDTSTLKFTKWNHL